MAAKVASSLHANGAWGSWPMPLGRRDAAFTWGPTSRRDRFEVRPSCVVLVPWSLKLLPIFGCSRI
eukprot:6500769-Pyramimonas_sp.AAC.1